MDERRFGILIANSRFPDEPKLESLRCPENDVDVFGQVLGAQDRGAFHELVVFKNRPRAEIYQKLNSIFNCAAKEDLILIYYSGHGKLNSVGRLHLTTIDTHLGALEATAISMGAIHELVDISATQKVVIILDCCFSGAVGEEFLRSSVDDQLLLASKARGTYIMTASTAIQVAKEKEADQHGLFTKHLIEGIRSGDADLDQNGQIDMDELYRYVHERVLAESPQEPMRWALNVRGGLNIARSGKTRRTVRNQRLRTLLADLYKESLPDDIFDTARELINLPLEKISGKLKVYDQLLDQLLDQTIKPLEFIKAWYHLDDRAYSATVPPDKPAPPPADTAAQPLNKPEPHQEPSMAAVGAMNVAEIASSVEKTRPSQKPKRSKTPFVLALAAVIVALLALVIFAFIQITEPRLYWDFRFNRVFAKLERTQRDAAGATTLTALQNFQTAREHVDQEWGALVHEAESKDLETNAWHRRRDELEERWRQTLERKQITFHVTTERKQATFYDANTYKNLVDLKVDTTQLVESFDTRKVEENEGSIAAVNRNLKKAYEYVRGKGEPNSETIKQLGKILKLFEEDVSVYRENPPGTLGKRYFQEAAMVLGMAFDIAIAAENEKNSR